MSQAAPARFRWYELQTPDAAGAAAFYQAVVGWKPEVMGDGPAAYTTLNTARGGVAGIMTLGAGEGPARWIGYVGVDDVDAAVDRVVAGGGSVRQPATDVPGMLRFAGVADPQGAPFVVFKGTSPEGPPTGAPGEVGYVGWHELMADDSQTALAFYDDQFGWTQTQAFEMGPMGTYRLWTDGSGRDTGGMMTRTGGPGGVPAPTWRYYINVDSADAAVARIQAAGGTLSNGPHQVPTGEWVLGAVDPQGATFNLSSPHR